MDSKFQAPVQLSDVQLQTLMLIMFAPTPAAGADTLKANQKAHMSGQVLAQKGLIQSTGEGIQITDKGLEMLDQMNVIDKQGQRTPYGEQEFTKAVQLNNSESQTSESVFPLLSSVSQLV
ncbi:hypothetical protein D3C87_1277310 [compost metagenome]